MQWYCEKSKVLKERLFFLGKITVHRGGSWMDTKLKNTYTITKERIKTEKEIHIAGMPETVKVSECEKTYLLIDKIV